MPKANPAAIVPANMAHCPVCKHALHRAETGWVCPRGLTHTRLIGDCVLAETIQGQLPTERPAAMSVHQWGWFRSRPDGWARRIVRELRRQMRQKLGGGSEGTDCDGRLPGMTSNDDGNTSKGNDQP